MLRPRPRTLPPSADHVAVSTVAAALKAAKVVVFGPSSMEYAYISLSIRNPGGGMAAP